VKIKRGDEVVIIAGKDKGKRGAVRVVSRDEDTVVVEGVNLVKKHQKARPGVRQAGIVDQENPLHVSNVMLRCPNCGRPTRVGVRRDEAGHKTRYCRHCEQSVDRT
jgi:large subunit ribosomal protein L24